MDPCLSCHDLPTELRGAMQARAARAVLCAMRGALQRADPRCKARTISPEDAAALEQVNDLQKSGAKEN